MNDTKIQSNSIFYNIATKCFGIVPLNDLFGFVFKDNPVLNLLHNFLLAFNLV